MIYEFNWEILSVDNDNKTFVVKYSNIEGFTTTVNLSFPSNGQTIEKVIENSAPYIKYEATTFNYTTPTVGLTGIAIKDTGLLDAVIKMNDDIELTAKIQRIVNEALGTIV